METMRARVPFTSSVGVKFPIVSASLIPNRFADFVIVATDQALLYWIMSALSNDPFTLARFAGIYKAIQSAGNAGAYGMDAVLTPLLNEHLACWSMLLFSFPLAFLVIRTIKETNYGHEEVDHVDPVETTGMGMSEAAEKEGMKAIVVDVSTTV